MRIKVITGYDGVCEWREPLEANLTEYCSRWGYDLVMKFDGWSPSNQKKAWRKIELIQQEWSDDFDWIVWLDADCYFLNMTIPITQYLGGSFDLGVTGPFQTDGRGVCGSCSLGNSTVCSAGILFIRVCPWSKTTMKEWWEARDEAWQPPLCQDYMIDTGYLTCWMMSQPETRKKIHVFPLTEIGWATLSGLDNQFILHCYGSSGPARLERFQLYSENVIR